MSFVPAKCTQCGAEIEVDESKEAGICQHCGTAFVTKKAINNYNTTINNTTIFNNANVTIVDAQMEKLRKTYTYHLKGNNFSRCEQILNEYIEEYPYDKFGYEQKLTYIVNKYCSQTVDLHNISINQLFEDQAQISFCMTELKKLNPEGFETYQTVAKPFHDNFSRLVEEKNKTELRKAQKEDEEIKNKKQRLSKVAEEKYEKLNKKAKIKLGFAITQLVFCILSPILAIVLLYFGVIASVTKGIIDTLLFSVITTLFIVLTVVLPITCRKKFNEYHKLKNEALSCKNIYKYM